MDNEDARTITVVDVADGLPDVSTLSGMIADNVYGLKINADASATRCLIKKMRALRDEVSVTTPEPTQVSASKFCIAQIPGRGKCA